MSSTSVAAECFEQAREHLKFSSTLKLDVKQLVRGTMHDLNNCAWPIPLEVWKTYIAELGDYCARNGQRHWFKKYLDGTDVNRPPNCKPNRVRFGSFESQMVLDVDQFGLGDVFGAAQLIEKIMGKADQVRSRPNQSPMDQWISSTKELVKAAVPAPIVAAIRGMRAHVRDGKKSLV
jgi:hypothetical protein